MRVFFIIYLFLFCLDSRLLAQHLIPFKDSTKGLFGYINSKNKKWIIAPQYDTAYDFNFNHAIVSKEGKYGLIDEKGKVTIDIVYESLEGSRFYVFSKGDTSGIFNNEGSKLIQGKFTHIFFDEENGAALLKDNDLFGYWDTANHYIPPFSIYELMFKDSLAYFNTKASTGFINYEGQKIVEIREGRVWMIEGKGFIVSESGSENFYDLKGKFYKRFDSIIQCRSKYLICKEGRQQRLFSFNDSVSIIDQFQSVSPFNDHGLAIVEKGGAFGIIDTLLRTVISYEYQFIGEFGKDYNRLKGIYNKPQPYILIKQNNLYGILSADGKVIIPPSLSHAYVEDEFLIYEQDNKIGIKNLVKDENLPLSDIFIFNRDNAIYFFEENGIAQFGLLNRSGNIIVPPKFTSIESLYNGLFIASDTNGEGILDTSGIAIVPLVYNDLIILNDIVKNKDIGNVVFDNYLYAITQSGKVGAYDLKGKLIIDTIWNNISVFDEDGQSFFVKDLSGKWMILEKSGKCLRTKYDEPVIFYEKRAIVSQDKKYGLIDNKGNKIVKSKYSKILPQQNRTYFVQKNSLWGLLSYSGKWLAKAQFSKVSGFYGDFAMVKKKDSWGLIDAQGNFFEGFEKFNSAFNEERKIPLTTSFNFSMKNYDDISFELIADSLPLKPFQASVNKYILSEIEKDFDVKPEIHLPLLVIQDSIMQRSDEYLSKGIEILNVTENTVSLNFYIERSGNGFSNIEEEQKVFVNNEGLKEVFLKDLFIDSSYTSFLNEVIASKLREADFITKLSVKGDIIFFDPLKFQLDKKGLILKVNNNVLDIVSNDFFNTEIIIGFNEIESIAKKEGPLNEFYK